MQNIPLEDMQEQLIRLDHKIARYERDLENYPADDNAALSLESLLAGAKNLRQRVQTKYDREAAKAQQNLTEKAKLAALAQLEAMESELLDCREAEAFQINEFARELEGLLADIKQPYERAVELTAEWPYAFQRARGEWPLNEQPRAVPLTPETFAGREQSDLYNVAALALRIARDTCTNGPLDYNVVVGILQNVRTYR